VIVPKVNGVPLAAKTPRFTSSTRGAIPELQGVTSLWVEAIPTNGAAMSLSLSPMAFIIERWGARIAPSVVSHERHLPGARFAERDWSSFSCESLVVVILVFLLLVVDSIRASTFVVELESRCFPSRNGTWGRGGFLWGFLVRWWVL
jgi:hypothetical protein